MGDRSETARGVAAFLDELLVGIEGFSARLEALEASGELTPELEASIMASIGRLSFSLAVLRESVDPTGAPMLRIKRRVKEKARELLAAVETEGGIRAAFGELVEGTAWALPEGQRPLLGPLVEEALDEVVAEARGVGPG